MQAHGLEKCPGCERWGRYAFAMSAASAPLSPATPARRSARLRRHAWAIGGVAAGAGLGLLWLLGSWAGSVLLPVTGGVIGVGACALAAWLAPLTRALEGEVTARTAELERANHELRLSEARFRALVEASAQIVWFASPNGAATPDNPGWSAFTGQRPDEYAGAGWLNAIHPDDRDATRDAWQRAVAERGTFAAEYRIRHHSGVWRWTTVRARPTYHDDRTLRGWVGMNSDAQERKEAEAALRHSHEALEARVAERTRQLSERNAVLRASESQLAAALQEKSLLLKEVHHRVKNNLQVMTSLLNLQSHTTQAPAALAAIAEARDRLATIALLHDKLYLAPDIGHIDLCDYLGDLARRIVGQLDARPGRVRLDVVAAPVWLTAAQAIPCGLIVNELTTNALKHAFAGRDAGAIELAVQRDAAGRVALSIADDGVGLPVGLHPAQSPGLGLQLVTTFTEQLDGALAVHCSRGTRFEITFQADA